MQNIIGICKIIIIIIYQDAKSASKDLSYPDLKYINFDANTRNKGSGISSEKLSEKQWERGSGTHLAKQETPVIVRERKTRPRGLIHGQTKPVIVARRKLRHRKWTRTHRTRLTANKRHTSLA